MLIMTVTNTDKSSVSVATRFLFKVTERTFQQKVHSSLNLRCQIKGWGKGGGGGVKINGERGFNISKYSLISVMNEKRDMSV